MLGSLDVAMVPVGASLASHKMVGITFTLHHPVTARSRHRITIKLTGQIQAMEMNSMAIPGGIIPCNSGIMIVIERNIDRIVLIDNQRRARHLRVPLRTGGVAKNPD